MAFMYQLLSQPPLIVGWVMVMMVVNLAGVLFWRHKQGKVVLLTFLANAAFMSALAKLNGFNGLLGLSHVIFWTPLVVWLLMSRDLWPEGGVRTWIWIVILVNSASLVLDYRDVFLYLTANG